MFFPKIYRSCLLASMAVAAVQASAQDFAVLEERLREHPSLQQLEQQALANREQATADYALPDPELSLGINNVPLANPSFDRFLPSNKAIGILQMFPNKAGREARSARMRGNANQVDALKEARFDELRGQLTVDLLELERIGKQRELAHARNQKYDELADVVKAEIDAGRPALFRLAEIESERAEVASTLVELDGQSARIKASLVEKAGHVTNPPLPAITGIVWSEDPQQFHAVRVASIGTTIADAGIDEARASWKTNWGVHLTYQQRSSGRGGADAAFQGDDWFSAGVKFSLPVWGKNKQAPNVRAAQARRSSAQMYTQSLARLSLAMYESLQAEKTTAEASQRVLSEKIEAIRSEITAQQTHYESGQGDYAPIIDGEIAILTLRGQIAAEQSRALSAIARSNAMMVKP